MKSEIVTYSIIIPHYSIPHLLERLISTIPERSDLQVIVVDDCSPDEIQDRLKEIKHRYPKVEFYSTDTNGGGGKARNVGLRHAHGNYIIFADADDYFNLCFSKALDKYKDTNFDLIYFASNSVDTETYQNSNRDGAITPLINRLLKNGGVNFEGIKYKFTAPWCRFISRSLIESHNIRFAEVPVYNDMFFCLRVEHTSKNIHIDPLAIYCVTERKFSVSSVSSYHKEYLKMESVKQYYIYANENNLPVTPLYQLLYPMLSTLRKERGRGKFRESINSWNEIGIGERKLAHYYWKGYLEENILIPFKSLIKYLLGVKK